MSPDPRGRGNRLAAPVSRRYYGLAMRSASPKVPIPRPAPSPQTVGSEYGHAPERAWMAGDRDRMALAPHSTFERTSFSGHETFPFRYTWLPKAVQAASKDGRVFGREDAMTQFGVGKNMVRSMRHWGLVAGMLEEDPTVPNNRGRVLRPTTLGTRLLGKRGWDPFLEDPATLWLLHWEIASTPERATTWYFAFSLMPQPELTKPELLGWLLTLNERNPASRASEASLRRDIDCFLGTYAPSRPSRTVPVEDTLDCPLVELGLLRETSNRGHYALIRGEHPTLPDRVFAYAVARYLATRPAARTVAADLLAFAPGSPGRVFALAEDDVLARLERIGRATGGSLAYDETAGLRQLLVHEPPNAMELLETHYGGAAGGVS